MIMIAEARFISAINRARGIIFRRIPDHAPVQVGLDSRPFPTHPYNPFRRQKYRLPGPLPPRVHSDVPDDPDRVVDEKVADAADLVIDSLDGIPYPLPPTPEMRVTRRLTPEGPEGRAMPVIRKAEVLS